MTEPSKEKLKQLGDMVESLGFVAGVLKGALRDEAIVQALAKLGAVQDSLRSEIAAIVTRTSAAASESVTPEDVWQDTVPYEVAAALDRACEILLMCSLPNDVSGRNMIEQARELRNEFTPYRDPLNPPQMRPPYEVAQKLADACQAFTDLFRDSDMRPEDECHEVFGTCLTALTAFEPYRKLTQGDDACQST